MTHRKTKTQDPQGFFFCLMAGALFFPFFIYPQEIKQVDLKSQFDAYDIEGCFVLYDQSNDFYICHNQTLCDSDYLPASTFKIPNAVIALEENIIADTGHIFQWDGKEWPNKSWNSNQTLRSAMKHSCIWVFFQIAEKAGIEKYNRYLHAFNYGNMNPEGPPTRFWLAGELRISAFQQVDFLRKFYNYELNVAKESIDMVKDIIILERKTDYQLSGKTGGAEISDNEYIMWFVGYLELETDVYVFAMNFTTRDFERTKNARYEITRNILSTVRLIE